MFMILLQAASVILGIVGFIINSHTCMLIAGIIYFIAMGLTTISPLSQGMHLKLIVWFLAVPAYIWVKVDISYFIIYSVLLQVWWTISTVILSKKISKGEVPINLIKGARDFWHPF